MSLLPAGSGTRAQLSAPWADWLMATSSRQPRGRLRKTPQQGVEAGGRHSVCVGLVLCIMDLPPTPSPPPQHAPARMDCSQGWAPACCALRGGALAWGWTFLGHAGVCAML